MVKARHALRKIADRREDKAHERIGPGSGKPGFGGRDARKRKSPGQKRFVDRSGPSYPSLGGAAPIHENGWPAGPNPRSRSSKTNRPEPADNDGGSATTVANTENVAGGARLNGTWERGHGSGKHPSVGSKLRRAVSKNPRSVAEHRRMTTLNGERRAMR